MSANEARVLEYLKGRARCTTADVARALGLDRSHASTVLSALFRNGAVQRSKAGGRAALVGEKEREWRLSPRALDAGDQPQV